VGNFLNPVLLALDKIYNFDKGQTAPENFALQPGLQAVHDVSREAEFGSGVGRAQGYMGLLQTITHVAGGTRNDAFDIHQAARAQGYDFQRHVLWLADVQIIPSTTPGFTSAGIYTSAEQLQGQVSARHVKTFVGEDALATNIFALETYRNELPIPLMVESMAGAVIMRPRTTASAAVVLTMLYICWCGAKGVLAPGVA